MIDPGRPFHAHEVLEASWKAAAAGERDLWQGLAQLAVGLTHAQRGNARGAVTLLRRGGQRMAAYAAGTTPHGIDATEARPAPRVWPTGSSAHGLAAAARTISGHPPAG